jgi:hypothetical protein
VADIFQLSGSYCVNPASGFPSGDPSIEASIDESMVLSKKQVLTVELDTDSPESVSFGDLTGANVVIIRAYGGKVRARFTSTDGAAQAVPVDPLAIQISSTVPITALDLTRVAGSPTVTCRVLLGQKAS